MRLLQAPVRSYGIPVIGKKLPLFFSFSVLVRLKGGFYYKQGLYNMYF
jgi:hypothetical protein